MEEFLTLSFIVIFEVQKVIYVVQVHTHNLSKWETWYNYSRIIQGISKTIFWDILMN